MKYGIRRYSGRCATVGSVTLCSARKEDNTLEHSYYVRKDGVWIRFDVRVAAKTAGIPLPKRYADGPAASDITYEDQLRTDLHTVAEWCDKNNIIQLVEPL